MSHHGGCTKCVINHKMIAILAALFAKLAADEVVRRAALKLSETAKAAAEIDAIAREHGIGPDIDDDDWNGCEQSGEIVRWLEGYGDYAERLKVMQAWTAEILQHINHVVSNGEKE